jgi:hypothetical protein
MKNTTAQFKAVEDKINEALGYLKHADSLLKLDEVNDAATTGAIDNAMFTMLTLGRAEQLALETLSGDALQQVTKAAKHHVTESRHLVWRALSIYQKIIKTGRPLYRAEIGATKGRGRAAGKPTLKGR